VCKRVVDFFFERLMPPFKFRKVRLNGHVASLLCQIGCLTGPY
jgi:hypothetical protein